MNPIHTEEPKEKGWLQKEVKANRIKIHTSIAPFYYLYRNTFMASGGVYVKAKNYDFILEKYPHKPHYVIDDITQQIIDFLCVKYDYNEYEATQLVEWGWQNEEEYTFLMKVKEDYLKSGLYKREYVLE